MTSSGDHVASESTPLLGSQDEAPRHSEDDQQPAVAVTSSLPDDDALDNPTKEEGSEGSRARWPTTVALLVLCLAVIAILGFGFAFPSIVKTYAEEAAVFEPVALSIAAFTPTGFRTRIQGTFVLDAARVEDQHIRRLGRFGTWLAREVETGQSEVQVHLPEYGNVLLGSATVPPIKVDIRNGRINNLDFFADLSAGDIDGIRVVGNDWLENRLGQLRVRGTATVPLSSGLLNLGSQSISDSFVLQGQDLPGFPDYNITKLNIHDVTGPLNQTAVMANVSITMQNPHRVNLTVPPMALEVLVPNCNLNQSNILVANATTKDIGVEPQSLVTLQATGLLHRFPDELTSICPGKASSPLDLLVEKYVQGLETTVYVSGGDRQPPESPQWLGDIFNNLTMPIPFTSHGLSRLIKRFSMTNVRFSLPEPFAEPGTPEAQPKFSSLVNVVVGLPKEMNFPLNISRVRATADVYYEGDRLGKIDLQKWQDANTSRNESAPASSPELLVEFDIKNAPLEVTDEDVFADVIQKMVFDRESVPLHVQAQVDAETGTPMGEFIIRDIPASGDIRLNPPSRGGFGDLQPKIESVKISQTTKTSVEILTKMNFTNPTGYSARIPYIKMKLAYNGTDVADVVARDLSILPGVNSGVEVEGLWDPTEASGEDGVIAGRDFLSRYVSGSNTSIELRSYEGSIPALPTLGQILSGFELDLQVPRLQLPGDNEGAPDDDRPHFIQDATVYLLSSTAAFTLVSPLPNSTLIVTSINATAFYEHDKPVGRIQHDERFAVPPGSSQTPRLPVDLDLGGAGYEGLKKALGGALQLDAVAEVGLKLGKYEDVLFYTGNGLRTKVRI